MIFPQFYETFYRKGIFKLLRITYDFLIASWLPIPMLYLILVGIIAYLFYRKKIFWSRFVRVFLFIVISFFWFWGFNYTQQSIANRNKLAFSKVNRSRLKKEVDWTRNQINAIRKKLQDDTLPLSSYSLTGKNLRDIFHIHLPNTLTELKFSTSGTPVVRILQPEGLLMRIKTAGIYIPHTFEGHIDAGMLPIEYPYVMAHEMSHAYGLTNEGECNFTAFIACLSQDDLYIKYSALIDYSIYLMRDLYRMDSSVYKEELRTFHLGYHADVKKIRSNNQKYPDILPKVRDFFYDNYLKTLGVTDGLKSYSQLVAYVIAFRQMYPNHKIFGH